MSPEFLARAAKGDRRRSGGGGGIPGGGKGHGRGEFGKCQNGMTTAAAAAVAAIIIVIAIVAIRGMAIGNRKGHGLALKAGSKGAPEAFPLIALSEFIVMALSFLDQGRCLGTMLSRRIAGKGRHSWKGSGGVVPY